MRCSVLSSLLLALATSTISAADSNATVAPTCNFQGCPATFEPICATNGGVYVNKCQFDAAHCKNATVVASKVHPNSKGVCTNKFETRPTILLVGDSITRRSFDPNLGGWGARLAYDYSPYLDVINRGMGGYTVKWMLEFGMVDLIASLRTYKPSLITFWLGTNDGAVKGASPVPLNQFRYYYLRLLHEIKKEAPKAKILLIAPPPVKDPDWSASIKEHGAVVLEIAKSEKLDVVDLYSDYMQAFPTDADLAQVWVDGVHPTAIGNNEMHKVIKAKIETMMPASFFTTLQEPLPETLTLIA